MLYDMNLKDILISPFKTWGPTTSEKKREKDVLKVAVLIYQLSTSEECHIGVWRGTLFCYFMSLNGKYIREWRNDVRLT